MSQRMRGWTFEQREAERALGAEVLRLRAIMLLPDVAATLGIPLMRASVLLHHPPWSEPLWLAETARENDRLAMRKRYKARRREAVQQRLAELAAAARDEAHERAAQSLVCLIDAYETMRPYLPACDA